MAEQRDRDTRFEHLELKIGIMVLSAIAGIVVIVVIMGIERDIFTKKFSVHFTSESGSGFTEGMPVKLSGFKIGRIERIELTEDAGVRLTAEISRKYQRWLRDGSRARLSKEGYIGDAYVEITVGPKDSRVLNDGDAIPYEKAAGIEELVNEAKPILEEIKEIIHYVNSPEGDIRATLSNIRELSAGFGETKSRIDRTLDEAGRMVRKTGVLLDDVSSKAIPAVESAANLIKGLESVSGKLPRAMDNVERMTEDVKRVTERLPGAYEKVDGILNDVKGLTGALSEETPRIRELLMEAGDAAREGKEVIRGVRESWPVRLMVPAPEEPRLLPLDAYTMDKKGAGKEAQGGR